MKLTLTEYQLKCLNQGLMVCGDNEEGPGKVTVMPPEKVEACK